MIPPLWQWPHSDACEACHELPPDVLYTTSEGRRIEVCACCNNKLLMLHALYAELQAMRAMLGIQQEESA